MPFSVTICDRECGGDQNKFRILGINSLGVQNSSVFVFQRKTKLDSHLVTLTETCFWRFLQFSDNVGDMLFCVCWKSLYLCFNSWVFYLLFSCLGSVAAGLRFKVVFRTTTFLQYRFSILFCTSQDSTLSMDPKVCLRLNHIYGKPFAFLCCIIDLLWTLFNYLWKWWMIIFIFFAEVKLKHIKFALMKTLNNLNKAVFPLHVQFPDLFQVKIFKTSLSVFQWKNQITFM